MAQRTVVLELGSNHQLARDLVAGGVFVPDVLSLGQDYLLVLCNAGSTLEVQGQCVFVDATKGSGLQLVGCDADMKQQIVALASGMQLSPAPAPITAPASVSVSVPVSAVRGDVAYTNDAWSSAVPPSDDHPYDELPTNPHRRPELPSDEQLTDEYRRTELPSDEPPSDELPSDQPPGDEPATETETETEAERKIALNVHERLRGLTLVQQIKMAQKGETSERIVLERMYGKSVWEPLLHNPRITGPEVARIARMGALPRTLIELIVSNGGWLQIPEVRRALLSNPRLGTDQILRLLRLLPKHELKLAGMQTAYPAAVREAAKRMLKEQAGG